MIGLAAALVLLLQGRIAGISGVLGYLLNPHSKNRLGWQLFFVAGLLIGGFVASLVLANPFAMELDRSMASLAVAGLLVGFGTRLGSGCTSGHGVCGIGRLSRRSTIATMVFMATGVATAAVVTHAFGGVL